VLLVAFDDRPILALSPGQETLLRALAHEEGPCSTNHYDGRTPAALSRRGLIEYADDQVRVTPEGAHYFDTTIRRRRRGRIREGDQAEAGRMILQVIEQLELAFPSDTYFQVGSERVSLPDLLTGLREFAEQRSRI
jgi:hypothetical protein